MYKRLKFSELSIGAVFAFHITGADFKKISARKAERLENITIFETKPATVKASEFVFVKEN